MIQEEIAKKRSVGDIEKACGGVDAPPGGFAPTVSPQR